MTVTVTSAGNESSEEPESVVLASDPEFVTVCVLVDVTVPKVVSVTQDVGADSPEGSAVASASSGSAVEVKDDDDRGASVVGVADSFPTAPASNLATYVPSLLVGTP